MMLPLVAVISVDMPSTGKRFEIIRALQRKAISLNAALVTGNHFVMAKPSGGQQQSGGQINSRPALGSYADGLTVRPAFGDVPATMTLTAFYEDGNDAYQINSTTTLIAGGELHTGYARHDQDAPQVTAFYTAVSAIKTYLLAAMSTALDAADEAKVMRLEVSGVVFGDGGQHFPR